MFTLAEHHALINCQRWQFGLSRLSDLSVPNAMHPLYCSQGKHNHENYFNSEAT
jgi:hypothetical protein